MSNFGSSSTLVSLPLDILVLIFPYLDARSFIALCSTCKAFHQPSISLDPAYWSSITRETFRVPNQPIVQHDGLRWQRMYRRLLGNTQAFTWGAQSNGRLGRDSSGPTPGQMADVRGLGIIADMQCGGWSTSLLTSTGHLYTAGVLDGESIYYGSARSKATRLKFSEPFGEEKAHDPRLTIRQFSAGRKHILGLSDSGRIWTWHDANKPARQILLAGIDLVELETPHTSAINRGRVKQVVAGWSRSSAYVQGYGIIVWRGLFGIMDWPAALADETIDNSIIIPRTNHEHGKAQTDQSEADRALGQEVGVVRKYILLADFVVLITDLGKVFCARLHDDNEVQDILELCALRSEDDVMDIHGSHLRFGLLKRDGVIIVDQDYLEACWEAREQNPEQIGIPGLQIIPALQKGDVISVAFGDYHFVALHANGHITSYGMECNDSGALGLGISRQVGLIRGTVLSGFHDSRLVPHAYTNGRRVIFGESKAAWLEDLRMGGSDPEEAGDRIKSLLMDETARGEVSEWVEQQLQAWEEAPGQVGDDGLGAYFALGVCAAGWHSGALLLVNEHLGDEVPSQLRDMAFPRLRLSDGREMAGTKGFDEWRYGRPEWDLSVRL